MKLPADKGDVEAANALAGVSVDELAPVIPELLEWLQDMNWPVAGPVRDALLRCRRHLVEPVRRVLRSDDDIWKAWVLSELLCDVDAEVRLALSEEVLRIVRHPTPGEVKEGAVPAAKDVLLLINYNDAPSAGELSVIAARAIQPFTRATYLEDRCREVLQERLFGERQYWQCLMRGLITEEELRDVLLADVHSVVMDEVPDWESLDADMRGTLVADFDQLLFGRAARSRTN